MNDFTVNGFHFWTEFDTYPVVPLQSVKLAQRRTKMGVAKGERVSKIYRRKAQGFHPTRSSTYFTTNELKKMNFSSLGNEFVLNFLILGLCTCICALQMYCV